MLFNLYFKFFYIKKILKQLFFFEKNYNTQFK
jgi:hypothetical protein